MSTVSFSGIFSGIDGDAVIEALIEQKKLASVPLENKAEANDTETNALEEFNTKLLTLYDCLDNFLTLNGEAVSKTATTSNSDALEVSTSSGASLGATSIEILNLAQSASVTFNDAFSSTDEAIAPNLTGTEEIQIVMGSGDTAETVSVDIDNTTTLSDLVSKINEVCDGRVYASAINTASSGEGNYVLRLTGQETGAAEGNLSVTIPSSVAGQGILQNQSTVQAEDAVLKIGGIGEIKRSTNQISDVIAGVTLKLKQENIGSVTVSVNSDSSKTAERLNDLVTALNNVIEYSQDNSQVEQVEDEDGETTNKFGSLAKTRIDEQVIEQIRNALSSSTGIAGSSVICFSELGVTTNRDGTLEFNADTFNEAMGKDATSVAALLQNFADKAGGTTGVVYSYTKYQGLIDQAVSSNDEENERINDKLTRLQESCDQQEESLKKLFANLESTMSNLSADGDAIASLLGSDSSS